MFSRSLLRLRLNWIKGSSNLKRIKVFQGGSMKNLRLDCRILWKLIKRTGWLEIINFIGSRRRFLKVSNNFSRKFRLLLPLFLCKNLKRQRWRLKKRKSKKMWNLHHWWWIHKQKQKTWILWNFWKGNTKTKRISLKHKLETFLSN